MRRSFLLLAVACHTLGFALSGIHAQEAKSVAAPPNETVQINPGETVQVNTALFNPTTLKYDFAVREGTVVDRNEIEKQFYDANAQKIISRPEGFYIINYGDKEFGLAAARYVNSKTKPTNPSDELHAELARQRGSDRPAKREATLDQAAVNRAAAIANSVAPEVDIEPSLEAVAEALGRDSSEVEVLVSVGYPDALSVVYGMGGAEATGWSQDPEVWAKVIGKEFTEVGVGVAPLKGRAQNLEGPVQSLVWVVVLTKPIGTSKPSTPDPSSSDPLPVGQWTVHQYPPGQPTGIIVGSMEVKPSGHFVYSVRESRQGGTLSVASGKLSMQLYGDEEKTNRDFAPEKNEAGEVIGYKLDSGVFKWLKPTGTTPAAAGPIPEGEWEIHRYRGAGDVDGSIVGTINIDSSGAYQQEIDGKGQQGTLSVADGVVTMDIADGDLEQQTIEVIVNAAGQLEGYSLNSHAENPSSWLVPGTQPPPPTAGPIPEGDWDVRIYEGPDDEIGRTVGTIDVATSGAFVWSQGTTLQQGTLSVVDGIMSMEIRDLDAISIQRLSIEAIINFDDGRLEGYLVNRDAENPTSDSPLIFDADSWAALNSGTKNSMRWLVPDAPPAPPVEGVIPEGEWAIHPYDKASDVTGSVISSITVDETGGYNLQTDSGTVTGTLKVADGEVTMVAENGETSSLSIKAIVNSKGRLEGYELTDEEQDRYRWLLPQAPVIPGRIPVGVWAMKNFEGPSDQDGTEVGTINVEPSGDYEKTTSAGVTETGTLSVLGGVLTMTANDGVSIEKTIRSSVNRLGQLEGYLLGSDDSGLQKWLVPDAPLPPSLPGAIPEGEWTILEYGNADDETGYVGSTIIVEPSGKFRLYANDYQQSGTLAVADGFLTMKVDGGGVERLSLNAIVNDAAQLEGYEINQEQKNRTTWRIPLDGPIPVGEWALKEYRGFDETGPSIGTITVEPSGAFQLEMAEESRSGTLSVADSFITYTFADGSVERMYIVRALENESGEIVGYDYNDPTQIAENLGWNRWRLPAAPAPLPVGKWAVRQDDPFDEAGEMIGYIVVEDSGAFQTDNLDDTSDAGVMSVADGFATFEYSDDQTQRIPFEPRVDSDGASTGFVMEVPGVDGDSITFRWQPSVAGDIPVGDWAIRIYGPEDQEGSINGKITVEPSGDFELEFGDTATPGTLNVADDVLTLKVDGEIAERYLIQAMQDDAGQIVGYDLSTADARLTWETPATPAPLPVGKWAVRQDDPFDEAGEMIGYIVVEDSGAFQTDNLDDTSDAGVMSVADGFATFEYSDDQTQRLSFKPIEGFDGAMTGVVLEVPGVDGSSITYRWQPPVPGDIPVGDWAVREFEGPGDREGYLAGKITVEPSGDFKLMAGDESIPGTLEVADGLVTVKLAENRMRFPIKAMQDDAGQIVGYDLSTADARLRWETPATPAPMPVGTWAVRQFDGPADRTGEMIAYIEVRESGDFQTDYLDDTPDAGVMSVADGFATFEYSDDQPTQRLSFEPNVDSLGRTTGYSMKMPDGSIARWQPSVAGDIPVGTWAVREFEGPGDREGYLAGKITVEPSGDFRLVAGDESIPGTLKVADGLVTVKLPENRMRFPIKAMQDDAGQVVGYDLSTADARLNWETPQVPRPPVRGPIPVGTWAIRKYENAFDQEGYLDGTIRVGRTGEFTLRRDGNVTQGTLSVSDDQVILEVNGEIVGRYPIKPIKDNAGRVIGWDLSFENEDGSDFIKWLVPQRAARPKPQGRIPVGTWGIYQFGGESPEGDIWDYAASITVDRNGAYEIRVGENTVNGTLSVDGNTWITKPEGEAETRYSIKEVKNERQQVVGYDLYEGDNFQMRWQAPQR